MGKRNETIAKEINRMFPPVNPNYPCCIVVGERLIVTSGVFVIEKKRGRGTAHEIQVVDYYGEHQERGYPWIHPRLETYANKLGKYWEWQDAECVCLWDA